MRMHLPLGRRLLALQHVHNATGPRCPWCVARGTAAHTLISAGAAWAIMLAAYAVASWLLLRRRATPVRRVAGSAAAAAAVGGRANGLTALPPKPYAANSLTLSCVFR